MRPAPVHSPKPSPCTDTLASVPPSQLRYRHVRQGRMPRVGGIGRKNKKKKVTTEVTAEGGAAAVGEVPDAEAQSTKRTRQSRKKAPISALGSPRPNSRASRRAHMAALLQAKGCPSPPSPRGRQPALEGPLLAPPRAQAHNPHTSRPRTLPQGLCVNVKTLNPEVRKVFTQRG